MTTPLGDVILVYTEHNVHNINGTRSGADLTGGHSCSGRRGPWEAGPWRPPGLGGPGRL